MYVDKTILQQFDNMSAAVDNILECITVEIYKEQNKNVIINCIYRAPGSSIDMFNKFFVNVGPDLAGKIPDNGLY